MKTISNTNSTGRPETTDRAIFPNEYLQRTLVRILATLGRLLGGLTLFTISSYCVFGFLASFEPGNGLLWRVGYAFVGCLSLVGSVELLRWKAAAGESEGFWSWTLRVVMLGVFSYAFAMYCLIPQLMRLPF